MKKILASVLSVLMMFAVTAVYASAAESDVAAIGEATYATLADAIANASAGDTIKLLGDVAENVTIGKNLIIDGDDNDYTGKMTINKSITLTVEDVNFVEGNVVKPKSTGTSGTYTFKDCSFFSEANSVYAIEIRGSGSIIIEDCTSDGYYGFLQVLSSNNSISIKNVAIKNTGYAIKVDYSNGVTLENVAVTDSTYGFVNSNYGQKTINVKNCTLKANYPLVIWDRDTKIVNTFMFEGKNDFGANNLYYNKVTEAEKAYTKFVLADAASSLTAVEGLDVTNADYTVSYADGTYMVKFVAQNGEKLYDSVQKAIDDSIAGDTIKLLGDVSENITISKNITLDGDGKTFIGKITLNKVSATIENINFVNSQIYKNKNTGTAGTITVRNCSFEGKIADSQYAINIGGANNVVIENCNAKDVGFGFFYAPSSIDAITVKNVNIDGASYGIHIVYNNTSTIENVTIKNAYVGVMNQSYGAKTITFIDCKVEGDFPAVIWERKATTQTYIFEGNNEFIAPEGNTWITDPAYGKFVAKCTVDLTSNVFGYAHEAAEAVVENNVAPDCVNTGSYDSVTYCSVCGDELSREAVVVDALGHTAGAEATCQAAQTCTVCGVELDAIKEHEFVDYVSNNDATCQADGTKTAQCIYACGLEDTIVDEGTMKEHEDSNGNGDCDYCAGEFCDLCGRLHEDMISEFLCLLANLFLLVASFIRAVF